MKKAVLMILALCLFFSCTKKKLPEISEKTSSDSLISETQETKADENEIFVLYPNIPEKEGLSLPSIKQVQADFEVLSKEAFSGMTNAQATTMKSKDFAETLAENIGKGEKSIKILQSFQKNSVYFGITLKDFTKTSKPRYGDTVHKEMGGLTAELFKAYLAVSGDREVFLTLLSKAGITETRFIEEIVQEDYTDPVFGLSEASLFIDGIDFLVPALNINNMSKGAVSTLTHFWNPDAGWNSGNKNIWPKIEEKIMDNIALKIADKTIKIVYFPVTVVTCIIDIFNGDDCEHFIDLEKTVRGLIITALGKYYTLITNPPSAYYKALCYWYGWHKITSNGIFPQKGILDYLKSWKTSQNPNDLKSALFYLARTMHLLEDMSVPEHVHNAPHLQTAAWDKAGGVGDIIGKIHLASSKDAMNETYRFEISPQYQIISWTPYTSKYANIYEEMKKENSFTFMADAYFKAFNSGETLYDLFYSTAQAAQFFPALADDVHYAGNNVVAFQTPFLQTAPGFRSWEFDPGYQQGLVYAKRDIGAGVSVFQEKIIHQPCFSKIYVNDKTVSQYAEVVTKNAYCHKDIFLTKKAHFFLVYDNGGSMKDKIVFTLKDFIRELKNAAGSIDLPGMKTCEFDPGYLSEVTINGNTQTYSCTELMEIYREREAVSNIQSEKDLVELINIPTQVECEVNINGEMKPGKEIIFHPVLTLRLRQFPHLINLTVQPAYLNGMTVKLISPDGFLYSQIIGSDGKEKGSFIKIYTAHYPYNKMTEYLIPMSLGGNLKLLKNFFQSDFIK